MRHIEETRKKTARNVPISSMKPSIHSSNPRFDTSKWRAIRTPVVFFPRPIYIHRTHDTSFKSIRFVQIHSHSHTLWLYETPIGFAPTRGLCVRYYNEYTFNIVALQFLTSFLFWLCISLRLFNKRLSKGIFFEISFSPFLSYFISQSKCEYSCTLDIILLKYALMPVIFKSEFQLEFWAHMHCKWIFDPKLDNNYSYSSRICYQNWVSILIQVLHARHITYIITISHIVQL